MSSVHKPYDTRIFIKECKTLVSAGYDVTFVVPGPADQEREGVKFVTVPPPRGRRERMLRTTREVYRTALQLNADLYHFHDPELIPWGLLLRLRGKKVVFDVHEEAGNDILDKEWLAKPLRPIIAKLLGIFEKLTSYCFSGIVASRPSLVRFFPKAKTALVNNFPILGELDKPGAAPFGDRPRRAVYVGVMSAGRGLHEMVAALGALPDDYVFELVLAGKVNPESLVEEVRGEPGFRRLRLLGWQSRPAVAELLATSRFGVVLFRPIANHLRSFPTKLFEYGSAGLPTLGTDMTHWKQIIQEDGLGFVTNIEDPQAVAERFAWMTDHPEECEAIGARALSAVANTYNWDIEANRLLALYQRILS